MKRTRKQNEPAPKKRSARRVKEKVPTGLCQYRDQPDAPWYTGVLLNYSSVLGEDMKTWARHAVIVCRDGKIYAVPATPTYFRDRRQGPFT